LARIKAWWWAGFTIGYKFRSIASVFGLVVQVAFTAVLARLFKHNRK